MAQAGRTRRKRKTRKALPEGMVRARTLEQIKAQAKRGVVEGAEPEQCPVCNRPSEGWYISEGKREWYHFGRKFNCVERMGHVEARLPAEGDVSDSTNRTTEAGTLPEV